MKLKSPETTWGQFAFGMIVVVVLLIWILTWVQLHYVDDVLPQYLADGEEPTNASDRLTAFGVSGDVFGFANAVFSALAFAIIIVTMRMQMEELSEQRKELRLTRHVFKQQRKEMKDQNRLLKQQRFETTFFRMLELHIEVVSGMVSPKTEDKGRAAFKDLLDNMTNWIETRTANGNKSVAELMNAYDLWYENYESSIGHYFRTLYNVIKYIDDFGGDDKNKATYARLVRAQLSSNELQILAFNLLGHHGKLKFKGMADDFNLLKHVTRTKFNEKILDYHEELRAERKRASG